MPQNEYDLIVIGSGGAGSTAATTAAGKGKRIALVERDQLGGTCLNYGCDPTKTLLSAAHLLYHARHASALGCRATLGGLPGRAGVGVCGGTIHYHDWLQ